MSTRPMFLRTGFTRQHWQNVLGQAGIEQGFNSGKHKDIDFADLLHLDALDLDQRRRDIHETDPADES